MTCRPGRRSRPTTRRCATGTSASCSPTTPAAASGSRPRPSGCSWTIPRTASRTRRSKLLVQLAEESDLRGRIDAMFRGDQINVTEHRSVLHVALRAPKGQSIVVDGEGRRARGPRRARQDGRLLREDPERRVEGVHRQADPQRHQHRHRRLGPRPGDGLRGPEALQRSQPDVPLRLERRRHRLRRGHPRPRPGRDAVHRLLEDVHDAGDDDQRPDRARLVPGGPARREGRSRGTSSPSRPTPRR